MKLTDDQLFELFMALERGRCEVSWTQTSLAEREKYAAFERQSLQQLLEQSAGRPEKWRQELRENIELVGQPELLERRQRERFYALSEKEKAKGRSGVKQAINDMLHLFDQGYFHLDVWEAVDRRLAAHRLPCLDKLLDQFSGKHLKILKRGRIRNEEEYYVVQNILSDLESDVTDEQRVALERLSLEFGQRAKG